MKIVRVEGPLTQLCSGPCGRELPLDQFYDKRENDLFSICIDDYLAAKRERYAAHKVPKVARTEKTCVGCGEVLPVEQFGWKSKKEGRRRERCPICHNAETRKYKATNRAQIRAGDAAYREAVGLETLAERQRTWRAENPERAKEISAKSKVKHKDRVRTDTQRRRDSLRGRGGKTSAPELRAMFARYGWRCVRCGELKPLAFDHVDPRGPGSLANGQPLCTSCNSWKLTRTDDGLDFRTYSLYDTRPDLPAGTVDLAMADLPVPEWVHHPRRQIAAEATEKLCLGPLHGESGTMLDIEMFPIRSVKSGKSYRTPYCRDCKNEKQRQARANG